MSSRGELGNLEFGIRNLECVQALGLAEQSRIVYEFQIPDSKFLITGSDIHAE
jgi:hypothetical protein